MCGKHKLMGRRWGWRGEPRPVAHLWHPSQVGSDSLHFRMEAWELGIFTGGNQRMESWLVDVGVERLCVCLPAFVVGEAGYSVGEAGI